MTAPLFPGPTISKRYTTLLDATHPQLWGYCLARGLHRHIFRQDAVLYKTDHTILRILVKFSWHIPDFPIYSNGTKPGTVHVGKQRLYPFMPPGEENHSTKKQDDSDTH